MCWSFNMSSILQFELLVLSSEILKPCNSLESLDALYLFSLKLESLLEPTILRCMMLPNSSFRLGPFMTIFNGQKQISSNSSVKGSNHHHHGHGRYDRDGRRHGRDGGHHLLSSQTTSTWRMRCKHNPTLQFRVLKTRNSLIHVGVHLLRATMRCFCAQNSGLE